jgi:hypothetical protein
MGGRKHDPGLVKASVKAHPLPKSRTAAPAKKPTNGVSLQLESDLNDSSFEEFSGTRK